MRAAISQQPNLAGGIAERDQVFAKQPHSQRIAVRRRKLGRHGEGLPVLAQQLAH
jgi:hypothetical protein